MLTLLPTRLLPQYGLELFGGIPIFQSSSILVSSVLRALTMNLRGKTPLRARKHLCVPHSEEAREALAKTVGQVVGCLDGTPRNAALRPKGKAWMNGRNE